MDYFNEAERESQRAFSRWRDRTLSPVLTTMERLGITPNHITMFSIALLVGACLLPPSYFLTAPLMLFFYCVLDGFDGPLARRLGKAHEGGAIVDICADQAGVVLVAAAAVYHLDANGVAAVLFANFYVAFITLALYANQKSIPIWGFLRIKYFFYFIFSLSILFEAQWIKDFGEWTVYLHGWTTYLMTIFAVYYGVLLLHALSRIYNHFASRHDAATESESK